MIESDSRQSRLQSCFQEVEESSDCSSEPFAIVVVRRLSHRHCPMDFRRESCNCCICYAMPLLVEGCQRRGVEGEGFMRIKWGERGF